MSGRQANKLDFVFAIWLVLIFVSSFVVRYAFNFALPHVNCFSVTDASEYLRNAQALVNLRHLPTSTWGDCLAGLLPNAPVTLLSKLKTTFAPLHDFYISGPIFPSFLALCFIIAQQSFDPTNWMVPLMVQSVLSSLVCVFMAIIGNYAWDKKTGIVAGFIACFYPAFIINSGRLYSESFATFLISFLLYLIVRGLNSKNFELWNSFLLGFTAAALQLSRSIMFIVTLFLLPLEFFKRDGNRWKRLFLLVIGFFVIAAPWLAWQKLAFGTTSLIVDRVSHYNFSVGNNIDTLGWLSFPYPDMRGIQEGSFPQLLTRAVKQNPTRWFKLMLDKPLRLFEHPWNDCRLTIGPFGVLEQVIYHQLVIAFALVGLILTLFIYNKKKPSQQQLVSRFVITGLLSIHFAYLFFITIPRYNLTSMPEVILLAAAGLIALLTASKVRLARSLIALLVLSIIVANVAAVLHLVPWIYPWIALYFPIILKAYIICQLIYWLMKLIAKSKGSRLVAHSLCLVLGTLVLAELCLPLGADGRWTEYSQVISNNEQSVRQEIFLSPEALCRLKNETGFLAIDFQGTHPFLTSANITVNGIPCDGTLIPGLAFLEDPPIYESFGTNELLLEGSYIYNSLTSPASLSNLDLRQWYFVPLPPAVFTNSPTLNKLDIVVHSSANNPVTVYGALRTSDDFLQVPSFTSSSWEKAFYAVENNHGLSDPRYNLKIAVAGKNSKIKELATIAALPQRTYDPYIRLVIPPSETQPAVLNLLLTNTTPSTNCHFEDTSEKPLTCCRLDMQSNTTDKFWLIRYQGKVRATSKQLLRMQIQFTGDRAGKPIYLNSYWRPYTFSAEPSWQTFDIAVPITTRLSKVKFSSVSAGLWSTETPSRAGKVEITDCKLQLYDLPASPIAPGHRIL